MPAIKAMPIQTSFSLGLISLTGDIPSNLTYPASPPPREFTSAMVTNTLEITPMGPVGYPIVNG